MCRKILFVLFLSACALAVTLNVTPRNPLQGNSIKVELLASTALQDPQVIFNNLTVPLYRNGAGKYSALLGTYMDWPTGNYRLEVTYKQNGKTHSQTAAVTLRNARFDVETLTISLQKQQEGATDTGALTRENQILGAAFRERKTGSYITGAFVHPLRNPQTPVTSPYGVQRHYRDHKGQYLYSWAHRGMDFTAKLRTPVYAVQNGVINVAEMMQVNGGIIILDHGQGVMSVYSHLDAILVKKNQYVTRNSLIAYSGNTGQSTGPHLHFGMSVHNIRVNPQEWIGKTW